MLKTHSTVASLIALFHLLSLFSLPFDLTFLTSQSCPTAALRPVDKDRRKEVLGFQYKIADTHTEAHARVLYTQSLYHLQNICSPSNMASKAACYLDCISFLMFQLWYGPALLQWMAHPPAALPESLQASVLHVPTIQASLWLSG